MSNSTLFCLAHVGHLRAKAARTRTRVKRYARARARFCFYKWLIIYTMKNNLLYKGN